MSMLAGLLLQDSFDGAGAGIAAAVGGVIALGLLAIVVVFVWGLWKVFEKAGEPGWAALVPIYNAIVLLKIAGRPGWWVLLIGAAWSVFLAWWCDLRRLDRLHGLQDSDPALEADHATAFDEEGVTFG